MTKSLKAQILLIIVAIFWGTTFLPVQNALNYANVSSFLFFRFLLATILMYLISLKFGLKFDKNSLKFGLVLGVCLFFDFTLQTFGLLYTKSSTVAFIVGLNIVIVPFLAYFLFREKLKIYAIIAVIIASFGIYLISGTSSLLLNKGEFITLISAIFYALHVIITGKVVRICNINALVITQFFVMMVLSFFFALFFGEASPKNSLNFAGLEFSFHPSFLFALLLTAVFATVFAFFAQSVAQKYVSPTKTVLIFTLEPIFAGIVGVFIGGEILSLAQIFGAILILVAILISELGEILFKSHNNKEKN